MDRVMSPGDGRGNTALFSAKWVRQRGSTPLIAVVGGGLSGLCAAFKLKKLGFRVVLYEARVHRVGGRANTQYSLATGMWAEGGPEFISSRHTLMLEYLSHFGLRCSPVLDGTSAFFPLMGDEPSPFDEDDVAKVNDELLSMRAHFDELVSTVNCDEPWLTPNADTLDRIGVFDFLRGLRLSELTLRTLHTHLSAEHGTDPNNLSLLGYLVRIATHEPEGFWKGLESFRIEGGISCLVRKFEEALQEVIRRDAAVVAVNADDEGVTLNFSSGQQERVDEVIVAVPPSLWGNQIQFSPALPWSPELGQNTKFLARVPADFEIRWGINPYALCDETPCLSPMTWDGTLGQDGEFKILVAMAGASTATAISEMTKSRGVDYATKEILGDLERVMPGITSNVSGTHIKDWPRRTFTRAGYYAPRKGDVCTHWSTYRKQLHPRVRLVGEPFSIRAWALMEGALDSATTAVSELAEIYG